MRLASLRLDRRTAAVRVEGDRCVEIEGYDDLDRLLSDPSWSDVAATAGGPEHDLVADRLLAPVCRPGKVICVGLNYRTHIVEMGRDLPDHPTLFAKYADTLTAPFADIVAPAEDPALDWEAELAVVVGRPGRRIPVQRAADHIAGYTVANDVSMRTFQFRTKEWLQGKMWEASTPLGPVLVTADEFDHGAEIGTLVDGVPMQRATLDDLLFTPSDLVSYVSTMITLQPGDVLLTGTPGGVGRARQPEVYLRPGQVLETYIEGVGTLSNRIVADDPEPAGTEPDAGLAR